jgi:hypothetical protein
VSQGLHASSTFDGGHSRDRRVRQKGPKGLDENFLYSVKAPRHSRARRGPDSLGGALGGRRRRPGPRCPCSRRGCTSAHFRSTSALRPVAVQRDASYDPQSDRHDDPRPLTDARCQYANDDPQDETEPRQPPPSSRSCFRQAANLPRWNPPAPPSHGAGNSARGRDASVTRHARATRETLHTNVCSDCWPERVSLPHARRPQAGHAVRLTGRLTVIHTP